ncbi:hypothetical protein [Streptomyces botrytidirepellens]|uniref:Uncharacterized protein n=1 Tax=Streptomyces botrytidirepellens TaxID=2486417 RepID=A0A3M8VG23_9ACTN|nr:hypothetical protein [Streptomyces botrytidirepellens]RNG16580.1 hypothetical protein EEJ42_30895 [Streptomyces botrytidirepellens]
MLNLALLLVLAASILMSVSRRRLSLRWGLAAVGLMLASALLCALAHHYTAVVIVVLFAAAYADVAAGQYRAARRQADAKSSQDSALRK